MLTVTVTPTLILTVTVTVTVTVTLTLTLNLTLTLILTLTLTLTLTLGGGAHVQPRAAASGVLVGREVAGHAAAHARLARRGGLGRLLRGLNETDAARLAVIRIGLEVHGGIHAA